MWVRARLLHLALCYQLNELQISPLRRGWKIYPLGIIIVAKVVPRYISHILV
jgi:hypothetical protein